MNFIKNKTFIIAEIGINHNGSVDTAKELIRVSKECGIDCVKIQKRTVNRILTKEGLDAPYLNKNSYGATYGEHKYFLEFSFEQVKELKEYANSLGILFASSCWDELSTDLICEIGDVPFIKIASADITNHPLLEHTAKKGVPMVISTGMSDMKIVKDAYSVVSKYLPDSKIAFLECTSSYPTPINELNLNAIITLKETFPNCVIGYSNHVSGTNTNVLVPLIAVVMGAQIIECHITLDKNMKGSDHACSLEPNEFKSLVDNIRLCEIARGSYKKEIKPSEYPCIKKLRKSLVSNCFIPSGTIINRSHLTVKGPYTGLCPSTIENVIGKKTNRDVEEDIVIKEEYLE